MSVTLSWRPLQPLKALPTGAHSRIQMNLEQVFGDLPVQLGEKDIEKLAIMVVMYGTETGNPYQALVDAITEYGSIIVEVES